MNMVERTIRMFDLLLTGVKSRSTFSGITGFSNQQHYNNRGLVHPPESYSKFWKLPQLVFYLAKSVSRSCSAAHADHASILVALSGLLLLASVYLGSAKLSRT